MASMFEAALERFEGDPDARARYLAHYDGRHDGMDALTWAAHPGTVGPTGAPDPAAELDELRRLAFGRSDEAARAEAERRLAALESGFARDRDDVRAAIEAVHRDDDLAHWHPSADPRLYALAMRERAARPALTAAAAAVVVVLAVLGVWGYATQLRGSLEVFDRPMSSRDETAPPWVIGALIPAFEVEVRWIGVNRRFNLYAVMGSGRVCIALAHPEESGMWSCTTREEFDVEGIELTDVVYDEEFTVRWGPRGLPEWVNAQALER